MAQPLIPDRWKYIIAHDRGGNFDGTGKRAYHTEVGPRGQVWARDPNQQAPHAYNANREAFGVSATGQVGQMPGQQQLTSLKKYYEGSQAQDRERFGKGREWIGHGHAYERSKGQRNQASKDGRSTNEAAWLGAVTSNGSGTPGNPVQPWHNASGMEGMIDGGELSAANWTGAKGAAANPPLASPPRTLVASHTAGAAGIPSVSGPTPIQEHPQMERKRQGGFGNFANQLLNPMTMAGLSILSDGNVGKGFSQLQNARHQQSLMDLRQQEAERAQANQDRTHRLRQSAQVSQKPLMDARLDLAKAQAARAKRGHRAPAPTAAIQEYQFSQKQREAAGQPRVSFTQWKQGNGGPNSDLIRRRLELQIDSLKAGNPLRDAKVKLLNELTGGGGAAQPAQSPVKPQSNEVQPPSAGGFQPTSDVVPNDSNIIPTQTAAGGQSPVSNMSPEQKRALSLNLISPGMGNALLSRNAKDAAWTRPTANEIDKKIFNATEQAARLADVESKYRPEFLTVGGGLKAIGAKWWEKIKGQGSLSLETQKYLEDYSDFKMSAIENINNYIRDMTGAQMSAEEAMRLRQGVPDPGDDPLSGDSPSEFTRKLNSKHKMMRLAMARYTFLRSGKWKGGKFSGDISKGAPISLRQMEGIMDNRARSLLQEAKQQNPQGDPGSFKLYVKQKLKEEFGV